jgi:Zn-dependent protease with chaperone function
MLGFFLECFAGAEKGISRDREIGADFVAAETAGAVNIATALVKIVAFTGVWDRITAAMRSGLEAGYVDIEQKRYDARQFFANASELYAITVAQGASAEAFDGLDERVIPHPTDSHPPLSVRLAALGQNLYDIQPQLFNLSPNPSSNEVIDNYLELESDLTSIEHALICPDYERPLPPDRPEAASASA